MQFSVVGARMRCGGSGNAGPIIVEVKLPKSDGTTSWMVFCLQFQDVADSNGWATRKKTMHPVTIMHG
jgi:hypothetical protein